MTSLRRLERIWRKMSFPWRLWDISKTSLVSICDFHKVITISDKIDVVPLETLKKWSVFWEQCIEINQVCNEYQWADICVRLLESQRSSKPNNRCIIYYSQWFFLTDKTIYHPLSLWTVLKYRNLGQVRLKVA